MQILFYADSDPTFQPDADPDRSFQIRLKPLKKCSNRLIFHIPYILVYHLQVDADPEPVPAYHFDADPDTNFYLMRIRILIFI